MSQHPQVTVASCSDGMIRLSFHHETMTMSLPLDQRGLRWLISELQKHVTSGSPPGPAPTRKGTDDQPTDGGVTTAEPASGPEEAGALPCPHGRPHWGMCPWCNGMNEAAQAQVSPHATDVASKKEE